MGMFDDVSLSPPIAKSFGIPEHLAGFQTKDLTNECYAFTITAEGRLVVDVDKSTDIHREPFPFPHNAADSVVDTCHQGEITFYTSDFRTNDWYEYEALFVNGDLQSISGTESASSTFDTRLRLAGKPTSFKPNIILRTLSLNRTTVAG